MSVKLRLHDMKEEKLSGGSLIIFSGIELEVDKEFIIQAGMKFVNFQKQYSLRQVFYNEKLGVSTYIIPLSTHSVVLFERLLRKLYDDLQSINVDNVDIKFYIQLSDVRKYSLYKGDVRFTTRQLASCIKLYIPPVIEVVSKFALESYGLPILLDGSLVLDGKLYTLGG